MQARLVSFGQLDIDGQRFDHDVVIEHGRIRKRRKGPSKPFRDRYGHTPLSIDEAIPWSARRIIIGTGADGRLPVRQEVLLEAARRGIELVVRPTAEACSVIADIPDDEVAAILHVTC